MDTYNDSKEASRKHIACSASGRASNVRGGAGHERDAAEAEASEARRVNDLASTAQCEMPPARTASVRVSILILSLLRPRELLVSVYAPLVRRHAPSTNGYIVRLVRDGERRSLSDRRPGPRAHSLRNMCCTCRSLRGPAIRRQYVGIRDPNRV